MDRQRFFEILCHGLTLCIDEIANELTTGLVSEAGRPAVIKCLADLRDTRGEASASSGRLVNHYRSDILVQPR